MTLQYRILPGRHCLLFARSLLIIVLCLQSAPQLVRAEPSTPIDDNSAIEELPETIDPQWRELRSAARDLAAHPEDAVRAAQLAQRYLQLGRRNADPRLIGYAQAALRPWWTAASPPDTILFLRASLKQTVHEFNAALLDLQSYLARPGLTGGARAQGLLTRSTVLGVIGRTAEAAQDCRTLAGYVDRATSFLCSAQIDALGPKARTTLAALEVYFRQGGFSSDPAIRIWGDGILGDLAARLGESGLAERAYRAALKDDPEDSFILAGYADFLLDQNRAAEVRSLLQPFLRADGLLLRHAIALKLLNDGALRAETDQIGQRFAAARERGDQTHKREESRYTLQLRGDAASALKLAQANWLVQREPADVRVLAEAAEATRDAVEQARVRDWLHTTGLLDQSSSALRKLAAAGA